MTVPSDRNTERDAHLQGALRHAPDASAAPSAALSDAILRAAHGAVAQARRPAPTATGRLHWLAAAWAWLGQPRLAGALAGLMVTTLVGVLWWDQPIERALDPTGEAPLWSKDSPAAPVPAMVPAETVEAKSKLARPAQEVDARAPVVLAERTARQSAPVPAPAVAPGPAPAPTPAPSPAKARGPASTRNEASAEAPAAGAGEARQPASVLAKAAPTQDAAAAGVSSPPAPAAAARRADAPVRERAELSAARTATPAPALKAAVPSASPAPASLAEVRAAISAQPERWTWQLGAQPPRAMTGELQAWLARLDATAGAALGGAALPESRAAQSATLHLLRDAQPHSSVLWGVDAVQVLSVGSAPASPRPGLAPHAARELAEELAQIAAR